LPAAHVWHADALTVENALDEQLMHAVAPVEAEYVPVPHRAHTPVALDAPVLHMLHWEGLEAPGLAVVNAVGHCAQVELAGALEYDPTAQEIQTELVLAPAMFE